MVELGPAEGMVEASKVSALAAVVREVTPGVCAGGTGGGGRDDIKD